MAAMSTGRNSIGFEIDPNFEDHLSSRFEGIVDFSNQLIETRINVIWSLSKNVQAKKANYVILATFMAFL